MSENSAWSPEELDSLENIDKQVHLVSTSSDSHSNHTKENGSVDNAKTISEGSLRNKPSTTTTITTTGQSTIIISKPGNNVLKQHSSCGDLSSQLEDDKTDFRCNVWDTYESNFNRSNSFVHYKNNKKTLGQKYDHVQSKIKHYFSNNTVKTNVAVQKPKNTVISDIKEGSEKEDYLEEINKQLTKELDEKNAILSLLQENYEHLLFKYAEAQNRIDELRFKFLTETDSKNAYRHRLDTQISPSFLCEEYTNKVSDVKCQKAVVAPFVKTDEPYLNPPDDNVDQTVNRPSSLPLDNSLKFAEKDLTKATTPTDSEGLSSIITSMSGHSKILNSLEEENQINKTSNLLKYQASNFILEESSPLNDPFDKVKNWQNSLPPLEQIETPETTLYVFSNNSGDYSPADTKYKGIPSPKIEKDYNFLDESCPASWREQSVDYCRNEPERAKPQGIGKSSLRASSLPNTLTKGNTSQVYKKKSNHSLEVCPPDGGQFQENCFVLNDKAQTPKNDVPSACIIQRRQKRPQLLRCASLPAYDYDSIKSGNCRNGIYIPPLDLANVTLSDDESSCQQDYYLNKSNAVTSSSFMTSRGGSIDRSIQTPQSFSSCKATISEENSFSRVPRPTLTKSTSITPDRSRAMDLFASKYDRKTDPSRRKTQTTACIKECRECCSDKSKNRCNVCGESISEIVQFSRSNRSNSCESLHKKTITRETPGRRPKPPFTRSVSFNSETTPPNYCSQEEEVSKNFFTGNSQESLDKFDVYASNLKARSQAVMKALTAHVNNS